MSDFLKRFRWPISRRMRILAVCVLALATLAAACVFFRISRPRDIEAYLGMASECSPVWKQFAFRRFGAGDSAQALLKRFPPARTLEFGRYGIYSFTKGPPGGISYTSISVATRDGKLLRALAGSCTWQFSFFATPDLELDRQYVVFMQERRRDSERKRLNRLGNELRRFYSAVSRWPTNETEFFWFVTGQTPQTEAAATNESTDVARFKARYGLANGRFNDRYGPHGPSLGIILRPGSDGAISIESREEHDIAEIVGIPGEGPGNKPPAKH